MNPIYKTRIVREVLTTLLGSLPSVIPIILDHIHIEQESDEKTNIDPIRSTQKPRISLYITTEDPLRLYDTSTHITILLFNLQTFDEPRDLSLYNVRKKRSRILRELIT